MHHKLYIKINNLETKASTGQQYVWCLIIKYSAWVIDCNKSNWKFRAISIAPINITCWSWQSLNKRVSRIDLPLWKLHRWKVCYIYAELWISFNFEISPFNLIMINDFYKILKDLVYRCENFITGGSGTSISKGLKSMGLKYRIEYQRWLTISLYL